MLEWITLGIVLIIVVAFWALRPKEYYPAESCGYTCPNMGDCQDCDCGYP